MVVMLLSFGRVFADPHVLRYQNSFTFQPTLITNTTEMLCNQSSFLLHNQLYYKVLELESEDGIAAYFPDFPVVPRQQFSLLLCFIKDLFFIWYSVICLLFCVILFVKLDK